MDTRRLAPCDQEPWAELMAASFGRSHADMLRLWQWLHAGYKFVAWGAWDGSRLIAQYSCLVSNLLLPQAAQPALIGISTNMTVHPDYRGQGLVKRIAGPVYVELQKAGCIAGVGFSNAEGVKYAAHPFRQYRFGIWQTQQEVCGVVVDRPIRVGGISGVALLAAYANDLPDLLKRWARAVRLTRARFVHLLATPASPLLAAVRLLGICLPLPYSRSPYYLTVKPLSGELAPLLLDFNFWDCCGGNIL